MSSLQVFFSGIALMFFVVVFLNQVDFHFSHLNFL